MKKTTGVFYFNITCFIVVYILSSFGNVFSQESSQSNIAKDPAPELVSNRFSFTEGPAVDKQGNIFFTDQPNNKIWKYDTSGKLTIFLDSAGRSNGMYFNREGSLITCADEKNQLW